MGSALETARASGAARVAAWVPDQAAALVEPTDAWRSEGHGYPACIYCPQAQYSDEAVKAKYQGTVTLVAIITAEGKATDIQVLKGLGLGLDEKAIEAVRTWRFRPAAGPNGRPAPVRQTIEVTFHLY